MGRKLICFGVDVDAVSGWLGSYGGEDSPGDISRGMFAGEVGSPRLVKLFKKYGITTTWFIPGHSLDTFPEQMAEVRDAGHEIGLHGYSHENPTSMSVEQQRDILEHTFEQLTDFCGGKPPVGSVAPWWEVSKEGTEMLLEKGILYDHSFQHHDCKAYWLRMGDKWTNIDYTKKAKEWMQPLRKGEETGMVQIPGNWDLDDLPPLMFIKTAPNSHGFVDVRTIEEKWKAHFEYIYREHPEGFVMPITIHPDVSGRPHVLMMLERFIEWVNTHKDVEWVPMKEIAEDFRKNNVAPKGARMPKGLE